MALSAGTRIGNYEILSPLGEGGMGVVYRARDTKLDRHVALKLLPDGFAQDQERLARFEREAKTLASLNHPHIAHVYGVEETGTTRALVMELVEGEDLSDRIRRGPIPLDEAVPIALEIAEALGASHEAGIIHRDLKPANIKLRADGAVKVLDFGLAKATDQGSGIRDQGLGVGSAANSPTITTPAMTMRGVILGTAAYMSPEQAKGRAVDKKADVWAFGCVLFEMLTGRRAFEGDDVSDTLASVLRAEPDWALLESRSNAAVAAVVRRCLTRDVRQRTHDIADVRIQLEDSRSIQPAVPQARARMPWLPALSGLAVGVVIAVAGLLLWDPTPSIEAMRSSISVPGGLRIYRGANSGRMAFALSPDGRKLAAVLRTTSGQRQVYVRRLNDTTFNPVAGSEGAVNMFWSPDSQRLGVMTTDGVKITDLAGVTGLPALAVMTPSTGTWARDRIIISGTLTRPFQEWTVGETTAKDRPGTLPLLGWNSPDQFLETDGLVYGGRIGPEIFVIGENADGVQQQVSKVDTMALSQMGVIVRNGHLLLSTTDRSGRSQLTAQPFDVKVLKLSGESALLATEVNTNVSASANGVLAYSHAQQGQELVWLNDQGSVAPTDLSKEGPLVSNMDLSGDDRLVVMQEQSVIRVHDLVRGVTSGLASDAVDPIWSSDQRWIAFARVTASAMGIYIVPANGGTERRIYAADVPTYIDGWSADGKWLAGHVTSRGGGILIPTFEGGQPVMFGDDVDGAVDETRFSPDGKWLAFGTNRADAGDVFVVPNPPTGGRWQVSAAGGAQPRWRADGKGLFFLSMDGGLMTVDFEGSGSVPAIGPPRELFKTGLAVTVGLDQYAVSRDGKRFLVRRPLESESRDQIELIVNWLSLIKPRPQ